jgi:transposase
VRPTLTATSTSRFCYLYQRQRGSQDAVLRPEHKAGEEMSVGLAGPKMGIYSAEVKQTYLFMAVFGASSIPTPKRHVMNS